MGDKYKNPVMDWSSPGDLYKRFQTFKQQCSLIFRSPLAAKSEAYKVDMLLLWAGEKGLEIYNTAVFAEDDDNVKLEPVWAVLEGYVRPRSNKILAIFQLRCLRQGDMSLEEFLTRARTLIDEGGYEGDAKEEELRNVLVFGMNSDKARRDAIAFGNDLTFEAAYNMAKTEESTTAQMDVITKRQNSESEVHAVRSRGKQKDRKDEEQRNIRRHRQLQEKNREPLHESDDDGGQVIQRRRYKPRRHNSAQHLCNNIVCSDCGFDHDDEDECPAEDIECYYCGRRGHYKRMCPRREQKKRVHGIVQEEPCVFSSDEYNVIG